MDLQQIATQLLADDTETRLAGLAALEGADEVSSLPPEVLRGLLACLGHTRKPVQRAAAGLLARFAAFQPEIISALTLQLTDPDPRVRWTAAFTLAQIDLPDPLPLSVLLENLGHEESDLRWAAATAILRLISQHPSVVHSLLKLVDTGNAVQRRMALYCLRDNTQTGADAQSVYYARLSDADSGVRLAALSCVGKLRLSGRAVCEMVLQLVDQDPDLGVRRAAAMTLGQLGNASSMIIDSLRRAVVSSDVGLCKAATGALAKLQSGEEKK